MTQRSNTPARSGQVMTQKQKLQHLNSMFQGSKEQIVKALAGKMNLEQFLRIALTTYSSGSKQLKKAEPVSIFGAVIQAAQLGLSVDPLLGEAYIIPRENRNTETVWASLQIGYQGLLKRCRISGAVKMFDAGVVRKGDRFEVSLGTDPRLVHERNLEPTKEPDILCSYAIAHFGGEDNFKRIYVCPIYEINQARARSESGNKGPWDTDYASMAQKTALRRLVKICPMDAVTKAAIAREEVEEVGGHFDIEGTIIERPDDEFAQTEGGHQGGETDVIEQEIRTTFAENETRSPSPAPQIGKPRTIEDLKARRAKGQEAN